MSRSEGRGTPEVFRPGTITLPYARSSAIASLYRSQFFHAYTLEHAGAMPRPKRSAVEMIGSFEDRRRFGKWIKDFELRHPIREALHTCAHSCFPSEGSCAYAETIDDEN